MVVFFLHTDTRFIDELTRDRGKGVEVCLFSAEKRENSVFVYAGN